MQISFVLHRKDIEILFIFFGYAKILPVEAMVATAADSTPPTNTLGQYAESICTTRDYCAFVGHINRVTVPGRTTFTPHTQGRTSTDTGWIGRRIKLTPVGQVDAQDHGSCVAPATAAPAHALGKDTVRANTRCINHIMICHIHYTTVVPTPPVTADGHGKIDLDVNLFIGHFGDTRFGNVRSYSNPLTAIASTPADALGQNAIRMIPPCS
ncbi:MAG: hypothetical protein LC687_01790, partial [Actinobacteria bacterium]|nr:hypothetical protein [Actinomycetota bacterium]